MTFLRYALILPIALLFAQSLTADTREDILGAIEYYAELWNEGDLGALRGYYHSDFKLITANGVMTLEQRMADLEAVTEAGGDRGELHYGEGEVMELGDKHALAYGRLSLRFKDGSSLDGWYSTLFVKTPFGWKALLTHS